MCEQASGLGFSSAHFYELENYGWGDCMERTDISLPNNAPCENVFGIDQFFIDKGNYVSNEGFYVHCLH